MVSTRVVADPAQGETGDKAWQRVDRSTLQLIANLFPAETCGRVFFARFVERASREPSVIPDAAEDSVYICTQSIATLGEELGLPNETAHKYVKLYTALGLLRKQKFMGRLAFLLSIGIYHPPTTLESDLEFLIQHSRPKLRTMAAEVKARCKLYGLIAQDLVTALSHLRTLLEPRGGTKHLLEQQVAHAQALTSTILANLLTGQLPTREDALFAQNLPLQPGMIDDDTHRRESESPRQETTRRRRQEVPPPNLPGGVTKRDAERREQGSESTQAGNPEKFPERSVAPNLSSMPAQVDSVASQPGEEATQTTLPGEFEGEDPARNLPYSPHRVDSAQLQTAEESPHTHVRGRFKGEKPVSRLSTSAHQVDSSAASPIRRTAESTRIDQKGRFGQEVVASNPPNPTAQVDSSDPANVNVDVITLISNITLNVKLVAAFCCNALDEPLSKQPIYLKLFRECEYDVQAISAALLFTLVHRRDGTMRNPASVFVARCRDYHAQGVPDEAAALVKQYGSLSYAQLLDTLHKPPAFTPPARGAPPSTGAVPPLAPPSSLSPLPRWGTIPRLIQIEGDRPGMNREAALQVIRRAQGDRRTKMCRVDLERLSDGSYAVLLDNTITAVPRQTCFYSVQEWETRTAAITDCFELFGVARTGRRCLADALKARRAMR